MYGARRLKLVFSTGMWESAEGKPERSLATRGIAVTIRPSPLSPYI